MLSEPDYIALIFHSRRGEIRQIMLFDATENAGGAKQTGTVIERNTKAEMEIHTQNIRILYIQKEQPNRDK